VFRFFTRSARKSTPGAPRRSRLNVEQLESRSNPSVLSVTSVTATHLSGTLVKVVGQVQDTDPAATAVSVNLSGVLGATVTADAGGNFTYIGPASSAGDVVAKATDNDNNASDLFSAPIPDDLSVAFTVTSLGGHNVQVAGQVFNQAQDLTGIHMTISGVLAGATATTDAAGHFCYVGTASNLGTVFAKATDDLGVSSVVQGQNLTVPGGYVTGLAVTYVYHRTVTVTGTVVAQDPGGLSVNAFGALGATAVTNADGTFSITTEALRLGTVQVQVTDSWGQVSDFTNVVLTSPPPTFEYFSGGHGSGNTWIISGVIKGPDVAGMTVTFSGPGALQGLTATVSESGYFWVAVQLPCTTSACITATVTDWWGQQATAGDYLTP
jgi:hypothetical protein